MQQTNYPAVSNAKLTPLDRFPPAKDYASGPTALVRATAHVIYFFFIHLRLRCWRPAGVGLDDAASLVSAIHSEVEPIVVVHIEAAGTCEWTAAIVERAGVQILVQVEV